jgi:hypothetical protein
MAIGMYACACACARGPVAGRGFYAVSINYLFYFREVFMLFAQKKTEPQFMACVARGGWDIGPEV